MNRRQRRLHRATGETKRKDLKRIKRWAQELRLSTAEHHTQVLAQESIEALQRMAWYDRWVDKADPVLTWNSITAPLFRL